MYLVILAAGKPSILGWLSLNCLLGSLSTRNNDSAFQPHGHLLFAENILLPLLVRGSDLMGSPHQHSSGTIPEEVGMTSHVPLGLDSEINPETRNIPTRKASDPPGLQSKEWRTFVYSHCSVCAARGPSEHLGDAPLTQSPALRFRTKNWTMAVHSFIPLFLCQAVVHCIQCWK